MKSMMIKNEGMEATPGPSAMKGYYPSLEISGKAIPELMDKDVGDICEIMLKVKVKRTSSDDRGDFANVDVMEGEYYHEKES